MFVLQIHYCIVLLYYSIFGVHVYSQQVIHFINFVLHVCCSRAREYYKTNVLLYNVHVYMYIDKYN